MSEPVGPGFLSGDRYNSQSFEYISDQKNFIINYANLVGVSATAVAGAMAKESNTYYNDNVTQTWYDHRVLEDGAHNNHEAWEQEYNIVKMNGLADVRNTIINKLTWYVLADVGIANVKIATAIRLLSDYQIASPDADPLDIKKYSTDYNALAHDLGSTTKAETTVKFWSLMIKEAQEWYQDRVDKDYWDGLTNEEKDGLLVTYGCFGRTTMEKKYQENLLLNDGKYLPILGVGNAGGVNHVVNSLAIGKALGLNNYGYGTINSQTETDHSWSLVSSAFAASENTLAPPVRRDPLILDLNGDGIKTNHVGAGTTFDHDGNGFAEQTGWTDPNDGLLVLDRNGDGIINDGKELFGDQTILANGQKAANGFQALAELDENADGKIDANDAAYGQLRVWRDDDGDGYSLPAELHTLEELSIASINVSAQAANVTDPQGNILNALGSFERADGTNGQIGSYGLQRDTLHTVAREWLEVPEDIAALPYLQGSGNVYDIDQAMVRDTTGSLQGLVEQFIAANDVSSRNSLMDRILLKWTGSDTIDPASRGGNFDGRKLAVLETFRRSHLIKWNWPKFAEEVGSQPQEYCHILRIGFRPLTKRLGQRTFYQGFEGGTLSPNMVPIPLLVPCHGSVNGKCCRADNTIFGA